MSPDQFASLSQSLSTDPTLGEEAASRLEILNKTCYNWETYESLMEEGRLDHIPSIKDIRQNPERASTGYNSDDWKSECDRPNRVAYIYVCEVLMKVMDDTQTSHL